jgi:hypothetical protein
MSKRKHSDIDVMEDDRWVWGVIFITSALTTLFAAALFSVAIG